jgi:beta-RFAP synthase
LLTVRRSETERIQATPTTADRIRDFLEMLRDRHVADVWDVEVHEEIPAHAGLGSGTQLGLALATAVSWLGGEPFPTAAELATRVGRGKRSAIGASGFEAGGFVVDLGLKPDGHAAAETIRQDFPTDWRFVLVTPNEEQGLSGELERDAFRHLPPMSRHQVGRLCESQSHLREALESQDFSRCSVALYRFGRTVGEYFASIQGGVFANPRMAALAEKLRAGGVESVGQTSWGPTLFALCDGEKSAESVASTIRKSADWGDCAVRVVAAMNHGAKVVME